MSSQVSRLYDGLIGDSPPIKALRCQIETAARSDLTVLITGESGTGKELVARAIHQHSSRSEKPFVSFNCGALTESLLESELFGYERGAFTGANQSRRGLFAAAHTGTIFLDEIGELSTACQVKFLRVLQESSVRPIGSHTEVSVDVRVIAATNRNLAKEISKNLFREDLFYRIAVLTISAPALRERTSDIPVLVDYFMREALAKTKNSMPIQIDAKALDVLSIHSWPGNVRELRNVIERLMATCVEHRITSTSAQSALSHSYAPTLFDPKEFAIEKNESLDDFLDRAMLHLYEKLRAQTGSHSRTAYLLRTDRTSLYQRIERARKRIERSRLPADNVVS